MAKKTISKVNHYVKWVKRASVAFAGMSVLSLGSIFYYAGSIGKTDILARRLWNTVVYATGLSSLEQKDFGRLEVHGLVSVYDGDTFTCDIEGLHPLIGERISIRIRGVDTPEMKDERPEMHEKAIVARDYVHRRLVTAEKIILDNVERDKYFRILADVYVDEVLLSRELLARDLAKPYDGGTKEAW
jgi:micrococcal nuclease